MIRSSSLKLNSQGIHHLTISTNQIKPNQTKPTNPEELVECVNL